MPLSVYQVANDSNKNLQTGYDPSYPENNSKRVPD
jgi:hypothetical protein